MLGLALKIRGRGAAIALIAGAVLYLASQSSVFGAAGINQTINFQGKVVNTDGTNVANGNYDFVFRLYKASSGGVAQWTETWNSGTSQVAVTDGIFRAALGTHSSMASLDFNDDSWYLSIEFNGDGEMDPRIRFAAVPYAFNAKTVGGLTVTNTTGTLTVPNGEVIQFAESFTTSGVNPLTLTTTGTTNVTLPTTGTLATLTGTEEFTNKTIGSTGLTFSGASLDVTTASNEDLTITPNGSGNAVFNLATTGDFLVQDATTNFVQFLDDGTITLGKGSGAGTINIGTGTAADTLNIATDATTGDIIAIGNSNASTTLAITGGDDWSITAAGNLALAGTTGITLSGTGADLIFANSESITNDTNGAFTFHRNDAGTVTLNATDDDSIAALTINSGGAAALTLDTGAGAALNIGTVNATSVTIGSGSLGSVSITTDGTGTGEVILPGESIGASEIATDTIDFAQISDTPTLDANTTVSLSSLNYIFDLTSTGEFYVRDSGNNIAQFLADGTITLGKSASASTLNFGVGTGADNINIGNDSTVGDALTIGNSNASTTIAITGGNDWSISAAGAAVLASVSGAGLSDCDASTSKLLWNDATATFSCGTDQGSNLQIVDFTDTTTEVATFTVAMDVWDGTFPNITPGSTNSEILISVNIRGTSDDANDQNPVFTIWRNIGTNPVCGSPSTQIGGEFVGGFLTATTQDWGATVTTSDAPSSTGNVRYTVCTTTTGTDDGNTDEVRVVLTEIGSSSAGGGGNVAVRETDTSPSVASASTIEFGPASSSSDEFIVTDEGSGVARIRIGTQVGLLNEAETVTGGWTFNTATTTFTTAAQINGGLTSASGTNLSVTPGGIGDFVVSLDEDTNVQFTASAAPGVDMFALSNSGQGTTTDAVDGLQIDFVTAAVAGNRTNAGLRLNLTSGATEAGDTLYGMLIGNITGQTGMETALEIGTGWDNGIVVGSGGVTVSVGALAVNSDSITSDGSTLTINAGGTIQLDDNVTITGSTGLTLSGTGADVLFANTERISNDTNGTITLGRNDAGTVTLNAADDDATAAFAIQSGGASTLSLDTGGAAAIEIGTANTNSITLGNSSSTTGLTFTKGASGNITLTGFNCSTLTNGGVLTTNASGHVECQNDDGGAATATYWDENNGAIHPNITTYDLLIGGTSTASSKFAFLNNVGGTPTASISASTSLILDAGGNIQTTSGQSLTLGGGNSGDIQAASNLRLSDDTNEGISGGGLSSDCSNGTNHKLLWNSSTRKFSCGTDQGGTGGSLTVQEQDLSPSVAAVTTLQLGPASSSSDEFIVTEPAAGTARVRLGTQVGLLNEAETVTGGWTFNTASTTFTTAVNANGGITTTTADQNLAFTANGAGDFVFNVDSGTQLQLAGGADDTDALVINAGDLTLTDGDLTITDGDFDVTLDPADTINIVKSAADAGDVFNLSSSSTNSIDGAQIDLTSTSDSGADTYNGLVFTWTESSDADVVNAINIGNTTSTNSTATALTIGTGWDSGIVIGSGGIAVNGGSITSSQSTLTIDAGGTVQISDNLTVTGTTGLTLSGTGGDIIFANSESITNDSNGVITFARNDAGTVTLNAADNDATAALTINSGGAAALTLDAGGAAGVTLGATNANAVTIGNTTSGTVVTINTGTGGLDIGDNANTKTIEIGGVDSNAADTVRIATNATSADSINIGNSNASTTMALTGGDDWSITTAGLGTFTKLAGAGLSDCDVATTSKLLWDSTNQTFSCGTDTFGADAQRASTSLGETTLANTATFINTVSVTPSTATGDIFVRANLWTKSLNNADQTITIQIRTASGSTCGGSLLTSETAALTSANASNGPSLFATYFVADPGASSQSYAVCALSTTNSGASAGGIVTAEVIDSGADLAEFYTTHDESIEAGDIVSGDSTLRAGVRKTAKAYESALFGIVSTLPALAIGNVEKEGEGAVPVALSGRVPVKVAAENGAIQAGDYLTSSSIPGVAMKATKAGPVIGIAMQDFDGEAMGQVLTFVKTGYFTGVSFAELLQEENTNNSIGILNHLVSSKSEQEAIDVSEILTDRVAAGLEIITPHIITESIDLSRIESVNDSNIVLILTDEGKFVIQNSEGESAITFDNEGNAFFAGTITAGKVRADQIEGIEILAGSISSLEGDITSLSELIASGGAVLGAQDGGLDTASVSASTLEEMQTVGALTVGGKATFEGETVFKRLATFVSETIFGEKVKFEKTPEFNRDTAGFAIIKKGDRRIHVEFDNQYYYTPVITATITINEEIAPDGTKVNKEDKELELFERDYKLLISNRSAKGFDIVLNKVAEDDIMLSWTAFASFNANTFQTQGVAGFSATPTQPVTSPSPTPSGGTNDPDESLSPTPIKSEQTPIQSEQSPSPSSSPEPTPAVGEAVSPTPIESGQEGGEKL